MKMKFGASAYPPGRSRALSPASRRSSLTSSRFFTTIVWIMALLTCASCVCPLVMILIPEISRSARPTFSPASILGLSRRHQWLCPLQGNSENFFTEKCNPECFQPYLVSCGSSYPTPPVQALQEVLHNRCL